MGLTTACSQQSSEPPTPTPQVAPGDEEEEDLTDLVSVEALLATETEIAVRYQIKEGWHLYWVNPGDSGLKTDAEFEGPDGVGFGPLRYPTPEAFLSPGDITSFGYEHEVVLFSAVELPDPPPENSEVVVHASWLACKSSCIRGKADAKVELAAAEPADDTLLVDHRLKLPRPAGDLEATTNWASAEAGPVLEVKPASGKLVGFFPLQTDPAMLEKDILSADKLELRYRVSAERLAGVKGPQGVLVIEADDGTPSYYHLAAPWPAS
jgi:DsbC/DsbD-like thiol-disulfide interchange protein